MDTGRGGARRCSRVLVVDREGERAEGIGTEGEIRESERGSRGVRGVSQRRPGGGGGSQAGRRWPGRVAARAGRVPVLLAGRKTTGEGGGGGLGQREELGRLQVSGPGGLQVMFPSLSLFFLFYFCFLFF